jgi:hypothetical protein
MEKGSIKIIVEEGKKSSVEAELVNNSLWLTKWDIARLFNCFVQKTDANLRSIFKQHLLWEDDVCYNYRYTNDKGVECQIQYYNMEVLIFLSYRIATYETRIFRNFVNESLREHFKKKDKPQKCRIIWISPPCYN